MKFEELPMSVQVVAANTLADILKSNPLSKESANEYADSVKSAFIKLYRDEIEMVCSIEISI